MNINDTNARKIAIHVLLMALLTLFSYWIFVNIYRINAFNIVPHDDYAPYLLYILGEEGGRHLGAPFVYRIFSVAVAVPFYYVLPFFEFSRLENVNVTYLRAVEALAMVSYISKLLSCAVIYLITSRRLNAPRSTGIIASLAALLLLQFSAGSGVDPTGILLVCLLVYYSRNAVVFGLLIIMSAGFNEKIALVFSMLMVSRVLFGRDKRFVKYAILSVLAFVLYLSARAMLNIAGNEHQMQFWNFLANAFANFSDLTTLKRFVLDLLPVITLTILYVLAAKESRLNAERYGNYFSVVDLSALLGLFLISMGVGMQFNIGRIAVFSFPFYLPLAAIYIANLLQKLDSDVPCSAPSSSKT